MKRLVIFLVVTFVLTWGVQISAGIALGTFENGVSSSMLMYGLMAVCMFFPLVGALAANFACKPEERIDLGWRPLIKKNIPAYLVAWFAPLAISLIGCVAFFVTHPHLFDPTMRSYLESTAASMGISIAELLDQMPPVPVLIASTLFSAITYAPFVNMIPAFGEELGWRGLLFPTLVERISPRAAAVVSGVIWGLWHAPVIAMGHNFGMGYAGFPIVGILTMVITCTALSCLLSLLRMRSGSVWPCALAHGSINAIANFGVVFCIGGASALGPSPLALVSGIPLIVIGFVCWLRLPRA